MQIGKSSLGKGKLIENMARYDADEETNYPGAFKVGTEVLCPFMDNKLKKFAWKYSEILAVRIAVFEQEVPDPQDKFGKFEDQLVSTYPVKATLPPQEKVYEYYVH